MEFSAKSFRLRQEKESSAKGLDPACSVSEFPCMMAGSHMFGRDPCLTFRRS